MDGIVQYIVPPAAYANRLLRGCSLFFVFIVGLGGFSAYGQEKTFNYAIKRGGSVIGSLQLLSKDSGAIRILKLKSAVKTSMILSIDVTAREEAFYQNGIMYYSLVYRNVNGDVKVNKTHRLSGKKYLVSQHGKTESTSVFPIKHNILSLYLSEPVGLNEVYSDNHQRMLKIEKTGPHVYKVRLPEGNSQNYYYRNGVCNRIEVNNTLYTIVMELI
jgi:hypothetical protein